MDYPLKYATIQIRYGLRHRTDILWYSDKFVINQISAS